MDTEGGGISYLSIPSNRVGESINSDFREKPTQKMDNPQ